MFYVCDQSVEYLIVLATFQSLNETVKKYIEKETSSFLNEISTGLKVDNITYIDHNVKTLESCKDFRNVCFRKLDNSVDKTLPEDTMKPKPNASSSAKNVSFECYFLLIFQPSFIICLFRFILKVSI